MSGEYKIAARDQDGKASIWFIASKDLTPGQACGRVHAQFLSKPPFVRARVVLVGIDGGKSN